MENVRKKRSARIVLTIAICVLLLLGVGLAIFLSRPKHVSAEASVWNGELGAAGWTDESTDLWGIDADAQTTGKTAAPASYKVDTEKKTVTLESAAALAYFSHEVSIDLEHKLDEYTVTLATDVDLNNKFWIPIGSFSNRAQDREDSVDNVSRYSGTFKGEVKDGDSVRPAKITNFTFDIKEVFKDATMPEFADEGRNGFKDVTLDVEGTTIKLETGDEGMAESSNVYYSQIEPFMTKFETEEDVNEFNEKYGTELELVNTLGGAITNDAIKAYYDEMRASDPDHAAEYNMLQNRFYNRIRDNGTGYRLVYKIYNKTFNDYFRPNTAIVVFKKGYEGEIRDGSTSDNGTRPVNPETGLLDTSTYVYENLTTSVDAGQVFSYGFFAITKKATISGLRLELGNEWDFSNFGVTVLDANGKDTGLKENLIVDQGAVLIGFGYGDLTVIDCQVGTAENGGLIKGTSYSNPAYGGLVGRMYGAHCGLPSSNPEDAALRPDEYYNKDLKAEFKNCKNYVSFDTFDTGTLRCGGIAGYMRYHANYIFENCENYGQMQAVQAGGITGSLQNGLTKTDEDGPFIVILKNCKNFGNVESVLQDELNGTNYDLIHPNLNVRSSNKGIAGGIVGNLQHIGFTEGSKLILENCENRGNIISDGVAGGLIAQMSDSNTSHIPVNFKNEIVFADCYNYGNVSADVAFTKIPVKSELLNPNYSFTKGNTYAGSLIGRISSGTLPTGLTLRTVTYKEHEDSNGKITYDTYGIPASGNTNAYAKDKNGNYVSYTDEQGNTVYQRYTRDFLNQTLLIHLTGANAGRIVSADPARGIGADCVSGGGARIFTKGSYFVDASDDASAVSNINLPEGFILWVTDAAGNGSATRSASTGAYTNNLLNYVSAITNFTNNKYHYISGREGAAEGADFNENGFPTFEWVDEMDWATQGTSTSNAKRVLRAAKQTRATTADYTINYTANTGTNSTWVDNNDDTQTEYPLANIAATVAKIKELNAAGKTVDIVIKSNVTSIAAKAFSGGDAELTSDDKLKINSVTFEPAEDGSYKCTTVGGSAFQNTEIGEITIPASVINMGTYIFQYSTVDKLVLDDVRVVGSSSFRNATEIKDVTISLFVPAAYATKTVSIGASAFQKTKIGTIEIERSTSADNTMTTWSIGTSAFQEANVGMIIAEDVAGIGNYAFQDAEIEDGLFTLYVPEAVTAKAVVVGTASFKGASIDTLSIADSEKTDNTKTTTTVNANAFENATIVTKLTITDIGSTGNYSFQGVEAEEISLTFYVAAATTAKTVGMGTSTFKGATIGKITIADSTKAGNTKTTTTISTSAFENATITDELNISSATIGATAFLNATIKDVAKIKLHDITSIGNNAFEGREIQEIEITYYVPSTLATKTTAMGTASFKGATIDTITIADSTKAGNTRTTLPMGANMFEGATIGTLIADGLTGIGSNAFVNAVIDEALITWYVPEAYTTKTTAIGTNSAAAAVFKGATIGSLTIADSTKAGNTKTTTTIYLNAFEDATISEELNISGATSIPANAFKNATIKDINKIVLHDITSIGNNAFENQEINEIEITTYVPAVNTTKTVSLGTSPFKGAKIGKITIMDSDREGNTKTITTVSANAFENATISSELNISSASIGKTAFLNANIKNINKIILHDITMIDTNAFENQEIKEIEITFYVPNAYATKTTSIGNYAFRNATIDTITMAASAKDGNTKTTTTINTSFENAVINNLTIGDGVTNLGNSAFKGAHITTLDFYTSVTAASGSNNNFSFLNATIGTVTFKKSANARPDDAAEFAGEYAVPTNALRAAKQVTSIVIENGITVIGNYAFYGASATTVLEIGTISLPTASLKIIGDYAFMYAGLPNFTIPASVTKVGANAFNNYGRWSAVYTVNFASGEVDADTLTTISLAEGSQLEYIGGHAFRDTLFDKMVLPASVTYVGDYAFARSAASGQKLANQSEHVVEFENAGANIKNLGGSAFDGARIEGALHLGDVGDCTTALHFADLNNESLDIISEGEGGTVVRGFVPHKIADNAFKGVTIDELTLGEGIVWIGVSAFQNAKIGNSRILVPSTVKWVGNSAFNNAKSIAGDNLILEFADPASLERIGTSAFCYTNIVKLVIPENIMDCTYGAVSEFNVTTNKNESVYRFTNHSSILADGIFSASTTNATTIYDLTLNNHTFGKTIFNAAHIKTLTINGDVLSVTGDLCSQYTQIYELKIGEDVGALVDGLFRNARIYTVNINNGDIEGAPFEGAQIKELNLTESALVVGGTLLNNLLVGTVNLPESITSINADVFTYSNIKTLVIPASVTKIDDFAFRATKVSNFRLAENSQLKEIGAFAFGGAAIDSYILPEGLEVIGNGAFAQVSTSVTSVTLPTTLKHVGVKAFGGNTRLNTVYIPEGMSADTVFDSPFDSGTAQNPLFIVAENADTYFRLKEGNEYFVGESNFTYVVTVRFQDEMGNDFEELEAQQVLFGVGYSTSLVYGQWVNNTRFALPDEFYNYVWRSGEEVVSNVGNLDAVIRNSTTDTVILVGLHRVGGKYAFVARTNIVYNGNDYTNNINALLDNRFSLISEDMDVQIVKYNQQTADNITIKNAGTYTISVVYDEEEDPIVFDVTIAKIVTAWDQVPYVISWDYSSFDKSVNNIQGVPNYLAADLPNADITYTVSKHGDSEPITTFTTDENGVVVEQAAVEALNNLSVLADNGNYILSVSIPETVNYTALSDKVEFRVGVLNNSWTTSLKVMSWVTGNFNKTIKNENGDKVYPIQAAALKGDVYIEVLANYTDSKGKEVILLDRTLCGSDKLSSYLSDMEVGTYIIRASVDGTNNYTGLTETFIFRVFEKPGWPWWVTLVVTLGALLLAALIIFILWKKGVFQILTEKIVVAIRTKASVDATIASVRAAKRMEEGKQSVADAKRRERIAAMREKAKAQRALPPEERAALLEERAKAHAERAEKNLARSEAIKAKAAKLRGEDVAPETPAAEEPVAEAAATETPETPTEE